MSLDKIKLEVIKLRDDRNWKQYHNPKDLALSIVLESSEILELFQWKSSKEEIEQVAKEKKELLSDEIADVLAYLINLADICDIDIEEATLNKLEKNKQKYPSEIVKGSAKKYNEY